MIFASIDIGTNTVLLTVADADGNTLNVLRDEARITRLGEGLHQAPIFLPLAQDRTLAALKEYRKIIDELKVEKIFIVGTAAFRKAKNAQDFIKKVLKETNLSIQIISGDEEARLSYLSATHDFGEVESLYVMDIGGGSTEIIAKGDGLSMDLGAVVMSESMIKHDPPTEEEVARVEKQIEKVIVLHFKPNLTVKPTLIGLAGSVTTLAAIKQGLAVWDGSKVQGSTLTLQDLDQMVATFKKTTNKEKGKIPGMVKGREDTILVGTLIARRLLKALKITQLTVSDRGLRFGLIYESFQASRPAHS